MLSWETQYRRPPLKVVKKKMLKFYKDFPEAWGELLTLKGFTTPAAASSRKFHAGIPDQEPIAASVPDFDE